MNLTTYIQQACKILTEKGLVGESYLNYLSKNKKAPIVKSYTSNSVIFSREEYPKALAVICKGQVTSKKRNGNNELVLRNLKAGDIFGIAGLFGKDTSTYVSEIVAQTDTIIVFFSEELLVNIFAFDPVCSIAYIRFLSEKIRYLSTRLDEFVTPNAYGKLALYLFENNGFQGSMSSLAKILGFSRMTLYRNLDILEAGGYIHKNGKSIEIINHFSDGTD